MAGRFKARVAASGGSVALALALPLALVCGIAVGPFGCSRIDPDQPAAAPLEEDPQATALVRHHRERDGATSVGPAEEAPESDVLDAGDEMDSSDGRVEHEFALLADAGRRCGSRFMPDCPLQGWMKQHANTLFNFGDISSIGEAFDEIAAFLPPDYLPDGGPAYVNWVSIAEDGARTVRTGNLNAAKAACRECHTQYRSQYHSFERARGLPDAAPLPLPPP